MPENDATLILRLPMELRNALQKAAKAEDRKPGAFARKVLREHLQRRGFLKSPAKKG